VGGGVVGVVAGGCWWGGGGVGGVCCGGGGVWGGANWEQVRRSANATWHFAPQASHMKNMRIYVCVYTCT